MKNGRRTLDRIFSEQKIAIMLGAGGVGKTTTSTLIAIAAAASGRRVALISIDPAKRLADALGIRLGSELKPVSIDVAPGSLHACMLDQKAVFDGMVDRHAPNEKVAARIKQHPVYIAASTNLSGPLEYMALAKLRDLAVDRRFDLIVIDTPPDSHALDFLSRPNVLAGFMDNKVMSWLIKPFSLANKLGLGRVLSAGEKLMGGISHVTGVSALRSFADFLVLMQEVIDGFHKSGDEIVALLKQKTTSFCLVAVPTSAAVRSAESLAMELGRLGYSQDLLILNRCLPQKVGEEAAAGRTYAVEGDALATLLARLDREEEIKRSLAELISTKDGVPFITLEDEQEPIHSAESLHTLAKRILASTP